MIILDTNVLSEVMRPEPEQVVVDWLDVQEMHALAITSITVAEILYGITRLPDGKRKYALLVKATAMLEEDFEGRILSFDGGAAIYYAEQAAMAEKMGRGVQMADAQIAAICLQHQAKLATRNVRDFAAFDVEIINPWQAMS